MVEREIMRNKKHIHDGKYLFEKILFFFELHIIRPSFFLNLLKITKLLIYILILSIKKTYQYINFHFSPIYFAYILCILMYLLLKIIKNLLFEKKKNFIYIIQE